METIKSDIKDFQASFDLMEVVKRALKYLIEGAAVAVAAYYIPRKQISLEEIIMIALTAAATFAVLDLYAPSISTAARQGAGFGIGANLTGFPSATPILP
jgi:ABC-type Co2+ transport system permease subunit